MTGDFHTRDTAPAGTLLAVDVASALDWLAAWGSEVAAADIASGRERFAGSLVAFGTHADVVHGREQVEEQQWSKVWPAIEDYSFDVTTALVDVSGDRLLAVIVCLWGSTGIAADGSRFDRPGRATIVLRRRAVDAPWLGVHTHFSLARGVPQSTFGQRTARR